MNVQKYCNIFNCHVGLKSFNQNTINSITYLFNLHSLKNFYLIILLHFVYCITNIVVACKLLLKNISILILLIKIQAWVHLIHHDAFARFGGLLTDSLS